MKICMALALALGCIAQAQTPNGEALFAKTCGAGYCHGTRGVGGGAPRLAARGFALDFIRDKVANGVPGTGMTAYGKTIPQGDLTAVIAYVGSLNGIAPRGASASPSKTFTGEAERGRVLFSEATRGFGRCSTCHQANGTGIAVAPPFARIPASVMELKSLATPAVMTARASGDSMPALMVARRAREVVFYDLTSAPPVLRTLAPEEVQVTEGSPWRHGGALASYSDADLGAVLSFLRGL
jgi:mono/diheme cytochrome c family protein